MIINKFRQAHNFTLQITLMTTADAHGKFADKMSDVEQIFNAYLDALKVKLDEYINSIPDKVV